MSIISSLKAKLCAVLIDEWRSAWRFSSVWCAAVSAALQTIVVTYASLPTEVRELLPMPVAQGMALASAAMTILARITNFKPGGQSNGS